MMTKTQGTKQLPAWWELLHFSNPEKNLKISEMEVSLTVHVFCLISTTFHYINMYFYFDGALDSLKCSVAAPNQTFKTLDRVS